MLQRFFSRSALQISQKTHPLSYRTQTSALSLAPLSSVSGSSNSINIARLSGKLASVEGLDEGGGGGGGDWNKLSFAIGGGKDKLAHLSRGSSVCSHGLSVVHAVVTSKYASDPKDKSFPLTVDYRSRSYAFGRIPITGNRRDRHGNDEEILAARIIDRAVRPMFPKGYVNEVQLTVTAHAADGVHDPVIAGVNAASMALLRSNLPWNGPIGCVRVGIIDGQLKLNPSVAEMENNTLDFVYAGSSSRPLM